MPQTIPIEVLRTRLAERPNPTSWARERLQGRHLDELLAAGVDLDSDSALTLHAYRLLMPRTRARLADGLEGVWRDAGKPHGLSAKAPLAHAAILATGPELQTLIAELRTDEQCHPRGVALTRLLLTDADSPLYEPASNEELSDALTGAYRAVRFGEPD